MGNSRRGDADRVGNFLLAELEGVLFRKEKIVRGLALGQEFGGDGLLFRHGATINRWLIVFGLLAVLMLWLLAVNICCM
ncbi:hypothetical protein D3C71_1795240 [compost metagenome]